MQAIEEVITDIVEENQESIAGYLKAVGNFNRFTIEAFVRQYGQPYTFVPKLKGFRRSYRTMKQCYRNAALTIIHQNEHQLGVKLVYVEGYALVKGLFPMPHAWVSIEGTNLAIDPTWKDGAVEYFGIPIKQTYLYKILAASGYFGVLDKPELHFPLLTGEHKPEDAIIGL